MRVWTLHPESVWRVLQEQKTLTVDPTHPGFAENIADFRDAYDWLRDQMRQRIPGYSGGYPWWAYGHFLDLRFYRWHHGVSGARMVRIALEVPTEEVLVSGYGDWHYVLSRWYLPASREEGEWEAESDAWKLAATGDGVDIYRDNPFKEPWESRLRESWNSVFDRERFEENTLQVTFETLRLSDVVNVTRFTSRAKL